MQNTLRLLALLALSSPVLAADPWITYEGQDGPGQGKTIVLVSGDEEYRSEEALPMLAKILAVRHGFDTQVLFAINPETGEIDPNSNKNIPGLEALADADLMIIATRWRDLPAEQMAHIDAYLKAGKPVIGLRTATHAFKPSDPEWVHYADGYDGPKTAWHGGFGRLVLGEKWISHHGAHKSQATRGILTPAGEESPITNGIEDGEIFGNSDVYGVRLPLPGDSQPIVLGQVLAGMTPDSEPVTGEKNDPMMPVAWTKSYQIPGGEQGRVFTTTMGAATDLANAPLRKLIVNAAYALVGLEDKIPAEGTDVRLVDDYNPTMYGFGEFKKGTKPSDYALSNDKRETSQNNAETENNTAKLELNPGDHISIIGNTLPDRMQHDGWLETMIQAHYPEHRLVIRNLAFSADELTIRQRSADFGSPDEWLTKTQADVVFAFFGFNESFAGEAGLAQFEKDLETFLRETAAKKYNGESVPKIILFSPIAAEDVPNPNLPAASELNAQIAPYVESMRTVAGRNNVPFVDLFSASRQIFDDINQPLTINGIHLNPLGNRHLALAIGEALFSGQPLAGGDTSDFQDLREAVQEKNEYWYQRYRTTDGYSVFGGRSHLKFVGGQTNRVVMQREMEVLDAMTANHDHNIWSAASNGEIEVPDVEIPPFIPVTTNLPGKGPNGTHLFLGGEEAIEKMTVADGLRVNLFASEEQFPELINPVQMAWDTQGRLFVGAWQTYPHWKPADELPDDKLLILEDTDGDGAADSCKIFADGLHNPTGFEFWHGGVLIAMAPELLFLKDTDGDDVADVRMTVLHGLDTADTHHTSNSFVLGPDGGLYFQEGVFHRTQVETPHGPVRNRDAGVWRFDPRSFELTRYAAYGFANPHGHSFDAWGNDIIHDGTGSQPYQGSLISGFLPGFDKHGRAPQVYQQRTRPCPGSEVLFSRHFPEEYQGDLLVGNVIGFQGILRYDLSYEDAALIGTETDPILSSTDPNFRPVDFEIGPDGALYFTDWQNPVIGHMQHNLRDPNRDKVHGRVYRVIHEGRELLDEPNMAEMTTMELLDLLKSPEIRTRYRARIALSAHDTEQVAAATQAWLDKLDPQSSRYDHHRLEALWVLQGHHAINRELLDALLTSSNPLARAATTRVLSFITDEIPNSLDLLRSLAADEDPRVRREAIRAASFIRVPEAVEVVVIARQKSVGPALEYLINETLRALEPSWRNALETGEEIAMTTEAGRRYLLAELPLGRLLSQDRTPPVAQELLRRPGVNDEIRSEAVAILAKSANRPEAAILLDAITALSAAASDGSTTDLTVATDLVRLLAARDPAELTDLRDEIEQLALTAPRAVIRQVAFAALVEIDESSEAAWKLAASPQAREDLLRAIPLIGNPALRADQFPTIARILKETRSSASHTAPPTARFVRVELPRQGTLTLAEVEIISRGENIAPRGEATQSSTANGGDAARAIDGNRSGSWGDGGQTHSQEQEKNPWWEIDLGDDYSIESVQVFNRTDDTLGERLEGFTLTLLDAGHKEIWRQNDNPAPKSSATITVGHVDPLAGLRQAAMDALVGLRGHEAESIQLLAGFIADDIQRDDAIAALRRVPVRFWPADVVTPLLGGLLAELREMPPAARTGGSALAKLELADSIASLLPVAEARAVRDQLRELGVRVVRIGTLPERMSYDKQLLAVAAGKPVEIVFENPDLMPHNLVIVQPGTLEQIGVLAEATARDPSAAARGYVPDSDQVLLASRLLASRESQQLSFNAPAEPGVYPFVCTYPGHWRRMYGALYVVEDLDAYLAAPEEYLAANPLPIHDDLLKDRRPRTAWTLEDLAPAVAEGMRGRSFANGKQMFKVANCVACHKLGGEGQILGPDLAALPDERREPLEVLTSLLDPAQRIEEEFRSHVLVTDEGRVITGMILEETDASVSVIENPLAHAEPLVLEKSRIIERQPSPLSIMPKGLLDTLTKEEILDLIAYAATGADQRAEVFAAEEAVGHVHGHHGHATP